MCELPGEGDRWVPPEEYGPPCFFDSRLSSVSSASDAGCGEVSPWSARPGDAAPITEFRAVPGVE